MSDSVVTFPDLAEKSGQVRIVEPDVSPEQRMGILEAVIFAAEDPPTVEQLATALGIPIEDVRSDIDSLCKSYASEARGVEIRAVGGGYRMFTKPQHHEAVKALSKSQQPRLKLSLAALETLAVVAYRQPVTIPEIQSIRGVAHASSVIHTLLRHKLVTTAGRKKVIGRPMQYKTTNDFLVHFGLNDLGELPTLKEMEELSLAALDEDLQVVQKPDDEQAGDSSGDENAAILDTEPLD
ncbi:MAG: SMC-Scp complex subunit ScpB [Bryobacterales bacterium]|nr:SMC-Scp complex subunit ScpB [Bryobacterales bacterium]